MVLGSGVHGTIKGQWSLRDGEVPWQLGWEGEAEAVAAAGEMLNKLGTLMMKLGQRNQILIEVVPNGERSDNGGFLTIASIPFSPKLIIF